MFAIVFLVTLKANCFNAIKGAGVHQEFGEMLVPIIHTSKTKISGIDTCAKILLATHSRESK